MARAALDRYLVQRGWASRDGSDQAFQIRQKLAYVRGSM